MATKAIIYGGALVSLNQLWYKEYPRTSFHFFNDNKEWLQIDKMGHAFGTYHVSKACKNALTWSGLTNKKAAIYGTGLGWLFISSIEILDGFSTQWGASTGDLLANTLGAGLFLSQELAWDEQRIQLKFSFHQSPYAMYRPALLGENLVQNIFKDYNGQTHWLTINPSLFLPTKKWPKWINMAFGYGAEGMISARSNFCDLENCLTTNYGNLELNRVRQYYFSLDVDWTQLKTNNKLLKTLFSGLNMIKIPFPALEFNSNSEVKLRPFYF